MQTTQMHNSLRITLNSGCSYENPLWDIDLYLVSCAPSGLEVVVDAYWDGDNTWRVALSPDEVGTWRWHTVCSDTGNAGLHNQTGQFDCVPYDGENAILQRGPLRLSEDRHSLEHVDGTPFFWLADTAWNGVIRGDNANWERYLKMRAAQGFTAIQFVAPHWRGDELDEEGESACTDEHPIHVNPSYFQRKDRRVAMINEHGLIAAPVVLWSLLEEDLGYRLPEEDAARLARYIVARYGAHQVVWLFGGDGNYQKMGVDRWQRLGKTVFENRFRRLVTLHPCGVNWVGEEFRNEPWYDIIGYQSGHGDGEDHLEWLTRGAPALDWNHEPALPVINLEPNYETARGYQHSTRFDDYHVRRAAYWSLLVSPTAGVTYGHDAIWNWNFETGPSEGHGDWHGRAVPPWHTGLDTPGIRCMTIQKEFFESLPWPALRPRQSLLAEQPGDGDVTAFIAAAQTEDGNATVVYSPKGGTIRLAEECAGDAQWFDPRNGECQAAGLGPLEFEAPDEQDWVLVFTRAMK